MLHLLQEQDLPQRPRSGHAREKPITSMLEVRHGLPDETGSVPTHPQGSRLPEKRWKLPEHDGYKLKQHRGILSATNELCAEEKS